MPSPAPKPPKAIIVGGSVAGLTLAHCFASAGIEFTLLEARDTIAPSIGATIVLMPNGCRILDQLSVYEPMRKIMTMQKSQITRRSDGRFVGENKWPTDLEERWDFCL
jgi:FAD dependent monooxygenase